MRQGQPQNRQRSRGRGNNRNNNNNNSNRNQLNRSMESNGPDVRIRGTAAHIAEKYSQMANDALTSGDTVAAQSYWQFAEHYNRLIAVAQAAQLAAKEEQDAKRVARGESDTDGNEGRSRGENRHRRPHHREDEEQADQADAPQPTLDDTPAEVALAENPDAEAAIGDAPAEDIKAEAAEKPRRSRRPRKAEKTVAADEDTGGLPSFVTGGE
ncbi:MAG: DUF4167 domain-containing protein [Rhizobiaceae bacterium]